MKLEDVCNEGHHFGQKLAMCGLIKQDSLRSLLY